MTAALGKVGKWGGKKVKGAKRMFRASDKENSC
jgi:hypothetical protein